MSENNIEIDSFKKTLDNSTLNYISKKELSSNKIDLRKLSEQATMELRQLENEAAKDYLKIQTETEHLIKEIDTSENILSELENLLTNFRDNLSFVKDDMAQLQAKSMQMNICLNNRKSVSNEFSNFIENVMIEPELLDAILKNEINLEYVKLIEQLCTKMDHIKNYNLLENQSIKEIEPELTKLKLKACDRIKNFLVGHLNELKKPKTNIQILQQNNLLGYKAFMFFLKEHNQQVFIEISSNYSNIMNKIFNSKFKAYYNDLNKLWVDVISKNDQIIIENPIIYKQTEGIFNNKKRIDNIGLTDKDILVAHIELKNNNKYPLEVLFISINKLLNESVIQEYCFVQEFFNLTEHQANALFLSIFKDTVLFILEKIKLWVYYSYDFYGILIISIINKKSKEYFSSKNFTILDYYFDQIEVAVWPKINQIFDNYLSNIKTCNIKVIKQIEDSIEINIIYKRVTQIISGIYLLNNYLNKNIMLENKGQQLILELVNFIKKMSKEKVENKDKIIYNINKFEYLFENIKNLPHINQQIIYTLESDIYKLNDDIVDIYISKYFNYISEFVSINDKKSNTESYNLKTIEKINKEFYEGWKYSVSNLKSEIKSDFEISESFSKVMNKIMIKILDIYQSFYNIVKDNYGSFTSNMLPIHKLTLDLKNIIN